MRAAPQEECPTGSQGWNRISREVPSARQLDVWENARLFTPEVTPLVKVSEGTPKWLLALFCINETHLLWRACRSAVLDNLRTGLASTGLLTTLALEYAKAEFAVAQPWGCSERMLEEPQAKNGFVARLATRRGVFQGRHKGVYFRLNDRPRELR